MPENNDNKEKKSVFQIVFGPLVKLIMEQKDAFASKDEKEAAVNQEGVVVNQEGVVVNQEGVAVNQEGVAVNQEGVAVNQEGVVVNQEGVVVNQEGVVVNQEGTQVNQEEVVNNQKKATKNPQGKSVFYYPIDEKETLEMKKPEAGALNVGNIIEDYTDGSKKDFKSLNENIKIYNDDAESVDGYDPNNPDYDSDSVSSHVFSAKYPIQDLNTTKSGDGVNSYLLDNDNIQVSDKTVKNPLSIFNKIKNFFSNISSNLISKVKIFIFGNAEQTSREENKFISEVETIELSTMHEVLGAEDMASHKIAEKKGQSTDEIIEKGYKSTYKLTKEINPLQPKVSDVDENKVGKPNLNKESGVYATMSDLRNIKIEEDGTVVSKNTGSEYSSIRKFQRGVVDQNKDNLTATSQVKHNSDDVKFDVISPSVSNFGDVSLPPIPPLKTSVPPIKPRRLNPPKNYTNSEAQISIQESALKDTDNVAKKSFEEVIDESQRVDTSDLMYSNHKIDKKPQMSFSQRIESSQRVENDLKTDPVSLSFTEKLKVFEEKSSKEGGKSNDKMSR